MKILDEHTCIVIKPDMLNATISFEIINGTPVLKFENGFQVSKLEILSNTNGDIIGFILNDKVVPVITDKERQAFNTTQIFYGTHPVDAEL